MAEASTGARVGPYRLLRTLGSGAMGTVYLAEEEGGERVALKVVHPHLLERRGFFGRFEREAEAGRRINHPNVVRTMGADLLMVKGEPWCFLVMEYVEGRTLRALLEDLGTVPEGLVREIARQTAEGLSAIHAAGVVHRDVKPENVLITDDHRVRIMDLGVARIQDASVSLTKEGQFAGSLLYAAPEQLKRGTVGPAADLYALGVVLHELATGRNPFRAEDPAGVMRSHLEERAPSLTAVDPDLTPFLAEIVSTLLEKEPSKRFPSAADLARVLEEAERSAWWGEREGGRLRDRARVPRVPVRRETRLHGREDDLALLRDLWTKAKEGHGSTLLVEGEAGIGKSRLVDAFLEGLASEEAHVLYGSYPPSGGMGAISDAILGKFGSANLAEGIRPYFGAATSLADPFAALLTHQAAPAGAAAMAEETVRAAAVHLMRGLAAERPLLWVVEDLHFTRADRRGLLLSLARAVEGHRVLLLLTTRPRGLPADEAVLFGRVPSFRRTTLARLGPRAVVLLVQDSFRSERLVDRLGARIARKSDGIPFFICEMIRGLKEGQFVTQTLDGSWVESKVIDEIEVPSSIHELVDLRIGDLPRDDRAILDVASVEGHAFDPVLVATVLGRASISVLQALADLERRSGVVRTDGRRFRFDHHLVQEVLYARLPPALREAYHAEIADGVRAAAGRRPGPTAEPTADDAYRLAYHAVRGSRPVDARSVILPALLHLAAGFRHEEACDLARRALAVPDLLVLEERLEVLLHAAGSLDRLGQPDPQRALLAEAESLAAGTERGSALARVHEAEARRLAAIGRNADALEANRRALAEARAAGALEVERRIRLQLASSLTEQGRPAEAHAEALEVETLALERDDWRTAASAAVSAAVALAAQGRWPDSLLALDRARATVRPPGDVAIEAKITACVGRACLWTGRLLEARRHLEVALRQYREIGDRWSETNYTNTLGITYAAECRHEESRLYYARYLEMAREIGDRRAESTAIGNLGEVNSHLGLLAEAERCYRRQLEMSVEDAAPRGETWALEGLARTLLSLGRIEEASACATRMLARSREIEARAQEAHAMALLARLAANEGLLGEAQRFHRDALAFRRAHAPLQVQDSLIDLALTREEEGRRDEALSLLAEAVAIGGETGTGPFAALLHGILEGRAGARAPAAVGAERRISVGQRLLAHLLLWRTTREAVHLKEARRWLDFLVEQAPPEDRESMLKNVRLHREILEAWAAHGDGEALPGHDEGVCPVGPGPGRGGPGG